MKISIPNTSWCCASFLNVQFAQFGTFLVLRVEKIGDVPIILAFEFCLLALI